MVWASWCLGGCVLRSTAYSGFGAGLLWSCSAWSDGEGCVVRRRWWGGFTGVCSALSCGGVLEDGGSTRLSSEFVVGWIGQVAVGGSEVVALVAGVWSRTADLWAFQRGRAGWPVIPVGGGRRGRGKRWGVGLTVGVAGNGWCRGQGCVRWGGRKAVGVGPPRFRGWRVGPGGGESACQVRATSRAV